MDEGRVDKKLLNVSNLLVLNMEKQVKQGAKSIQERLKKNDEEEEEAEDQGKNLKDFGSFEFAQNMRADYGINFKEGKHIDNGPTYKKYLEDKGLDKIKITKGQYNDMYSTRSNKDRFSQNFLAKISRL